MTNPVSSLKIRESAGGDDTSSPIALKDRVSTRLADGDRPGRDIHQDSTGWRWSNQPLDANTILAKGETMASDQQKPNSSSDAAAEEDKRKSDAQACTDLMFRTMWWNMLVDQPMKDRAERDDEDSIF